MHINDTKKNIWFSHYRYWGLGAEQTYGWFDKTTNTLTITSSGIKLIPKILKTLKDKFYISITDPRQINIGG